MINGLIHQEEILSLKCLHLALIEKKVANPLSESSSYPYGWHLWGL